MRLASQLPQRHPARSWRLGLGRLGLGRLGLGPVTLVLPMVLLLAFAAPAPAQVRAVDLYAPRAFGYLIGDIITHTVEIAIDAPFTLEPASLPQPRAMDYWLDLRSARVTDEGVRDGVQRYRLELVYQSFYAALEPKRLEIPGFTLYARDGERRLPLVVPAWSFLMSPLREIVSTGQGAVMTLRPDIPPRPISTAGTRRGLIAGLIAVIGGLVLTAWHRGWWPFADRRARPFARAARQVRASLRQPPWAAEGRGQGTRNGGVSGLVGTESPAPHAPGMSSLASSLTSSSSSTGLHALSGYGAALQALHRAFDATAGRGVFAEDLPAFLTEHPGFQRVESELGRLFDASRRAFFGGDVIGATRIFPPEELARLAGRLSAIERGAA